MKGRVHASFNLQLPAFSDKIERLHNSSVISPCSSLHPLTSCYSNRLGIICVWVKLHALGSTGHLLLGHGACRGVGGSGLTEMHYYYSNMSQQTDIQETDPKACKFCLPLDLPNVVIAQKLEE